MPLCPDSQRLYHACITSKSLPSSRSRIMCHHVSRFHPSYTGVNTSPTIPRNIEAYGIYRTPASSTFCTTSSGSYVSNISIDPSHPTPPLHNKTSPSQAQSVRTLTIPTTLTAYTPGTYPSKRCHLATQLCDASASVMRPSYTCDVHSWIASGALAKRRKSSQLGQPSLRNR